MEIYCFISIRISIRIRLEMIGGRGWLGWIWMDWFVTDLTEWCFCLQFWLWYGWIMLNWYVAVVWTWSFYYMIKNNWIGGLAPMINLLFWCHQPCFLNPIQFEKQWTRPPWEVLGASRMTPIAVDWAFWKFLPTDRMEIIRSSFIHRRCTELHQFSKWPCDYHSAMSEIYRDRFYMFLLSYSSGVNLFIWLVVR